MIKAEFKLSWLIFITEGSLYSIVALIVFSISLFFKVSQVLYLNSSVSGKWKAPSSKALLRHACSTWYHVFGLMTVKFQPKNFLLLLSTPDKLHKGTERPSQAHHIVCIHFARIIIIYIWVRAFTWGIRNPLKWYVVMLEWLKIGCHVKEKLTKPSRERSRGHPDKTWMENIIKNGSKRGSHWHNQRILKYFSKPHETHVLRLYRLVV